MKKKNKPQKKESDRRLLFVLAGAVILAAVFIAAVVLTTPAGSGSANTTDAIRIGAIYNLNGSQSSLDIPSAQGARLAAQEINERGGVIDDLYAYQLSEGVYFLVINASRVADDVAWLKARTQHSDSRPTWRGGWPAVGRRPSPSFSFLLATAMCLLSAK